MNIEKNKTKGYISVIIILSILVIALIGYIVFNSLSKNNNTEIGKKSLKSESQIESTKKDTKKTTEEDEKVITTTKTTDNSQETTKNDSVKTRTCTGVYSGTAALTKNIMTGEYGKGTLTIDLKADGTYELKKENLPNASGTYIIIDNALLLKSKPDICVPGMNCSAQYTNYLSISEDCSNISLGYGSQFVDPSFTLNK